MRRQGNMSEFSKLEGLYYLRSEYQHYIGRRDVEDKVIQLVESMTMEECWKTK